MKLLRELIYIVDEHINDSPSTIRVHLEQSHGNGAVRGGSGKPGFNSLRKLRRFIDGCLRLSVELLRATCRIVSPDITRSLVEEAQLFAFDVCNTEADTVLAVGALDLSDDTMRRDRRCSGKREEDGEKGGGVEEHDSDYIHVDFGK